MPADLIPTLDISGYVAGDPVAANEAAAELRAAMENVGFVVVVGHGLDWRIAEKAFAEVRRFFALPQDRKMTIKLGSGVDVPTDQVNGRGGYVRYSGPASSAVVYVKRCVESLFYRDETTGYNQWPSDLPGFREAIDSYHEAVDRLARTMLPLFARSLSLPDGYFESWFVQRSTLRLSHYPPVQLGAGDDGWGISSHSDGNFFTLLPANEVPGLELRLRDGEWIEAPFIPESFVVNAGDMLMMCSNDQFLSTPHRVLRSQRDRYAMPFFMTVDNEDAVIGPLPGCVTPDNPARYESRRLGDFIATMLRNTEQRYSQPRISG